MGSWHDGKGSSVEKMGCFKESIFLWGSIFRWNGMMERGLVYEKWGASSTSFSIGFHF